MQIALPTRPGGLFFREGTRSSEPLFVGLAALITLVPELALVERKYAIFGGGFGQSRTLDAPVEIAAFAIGLLASHLLLFHLLFRLLRRVHGAKGSDPIFYFNFLFLMPSAALVALVAKFQVLSYFSDAMSFQIIRNLGGGSLMGAFLYVLSEAGLLLLGVGAIAVFYYAAYRLFRRRWPKGSPVQPHGRGRKALLLLAAAALPAILFAAGRTGDAGPALSRFNAPTLFGLAFSAATDFDRDGYSFFTARLDPHPFDAARHPLALDLPDNGVDEDGFAGDLSLVAAEPTASPVPALTSRKHLVLIVLESSRGDLVGKRVSGVPVSTNISALAAEGTLIREAYSHVGFTSASLKSLFTGRLEPEAGGPSLFRDLDSNGYRIGVFSGLAERFGDIDPTVGMRRYSDVYVDAEVLRDERAFGFASTSSLLIDGQVQLREFDRTLGRSPGWDRPTFLYFNFQSAHFPYHNPGVRPFIPGEPIPRSEIGIANKEWVARTYWNSVAYGDWLVGEVVARLRRLGVYDDSIVVVTADHGESLFDDGFLGHGHMINRQQTHVPFVLNVPGVIVPGPVGLTDMRGLILAQLGRAPAPASAGKPVFQYLGTLDEPGAIGMVEKGGVWTTLDLGTEEVWFSDRGEKLGYGELPRGGPLRQRADRLVALWGSERWRHRLDRRQPS